MKVIWPIKIDDTKLDSSTVAASSISDWNSGTTYTDGDQVVREDANGIPHEYTWRPPLEDLIDADGDYDPQTHSVLKRSDINPGAYSTDENYRCYWLDNGPTNRYAMFDQRSRRVSSDTDSIVVAITPTPMAEAERLFDSVCLMEVKGDSVLIEVNDPTEGLVYEESVEMLSLDNVYDEYTWFFAPIIKKTEVIVTDIPSYPESTITITIEDEEEGSTVELGECVVGLSVEIGSLLYGVRLGGTDYSVNKVNDAGYATLEPGVFTKENEYPVRVDTSRLRYLLIIFEELKALPTVFIGVKDMLATVLFGKWEEFDFVLSGPIKSDCNIKVKEVSA